MLQRQLFTKHLEDDESIIRVVHKHLLLGVHALFWPTVSILGSMALLTITVSTNVFIGISIWIGVSLIWWLRNFLDYYLDAWIVTDHGIIDVEWHGWFHRQSSRVLYSDIQGVSYEIQGILPTLLQYGKISAEKISTGSTISMDYVHRPREVETVILKGMEAYLHSKNLKDSKQVQELLSTLVAEQVNLRGVKKS